MNRCAACDSMMCELCAMLRKCVYMGCAAPLGGGGVRSIGGLLLLVP